jgi:hypothetical protein
LGAFYEVWQLGNYGWEVGNKDGCNNYQIDVVEKEREGNNQQDFS